MSKKRGSFNIKKINFILSRKAGTNEEQRDPKQRYSERKTLI